MEDDFHKPGLYRWRRQTKPRLPSRSQKVVTTDDIQDWLQKVEAASDKAVESVLGPQAASPYTMGHQRGRAAVHDLSAQARIRDDAYTEAQDLLKDWISRKVNVDGEDVMKDDPDPESCDLWSKEDIGSKARRQWDALLNGNLEETGVQSLDLAPFFKPRSQSDEDPYANLYELEEDEAVSTVMRTMLNKDLVSRDLRHDIDPEADTASYDPRTKMEMRHQRVRENRQKREEEMKRRRKQAETKKEARLTARQIVIKEEKQKEVMQKKEEHAIRKQMALIRKQMEEARDQEAEKRSRQLREELERDRLAREELERQEVLEKTEYLQRHQEDCRRKKAELARKELISIKLTAVNLRTLHRHFTAWYDVVLARRLAYGKAGALADWRLSLRAWNAWRSYVRSQRVTIETKQHQRNVVDESRKLVMAQRHHYLSELRKHLAAWRQFVRHQQDLRAMQEAQEATRSKMASLLTNLAQGALSSPHEQHEEESSEGQAHNSVTRRIAWEEEKEEEGTQPASVSPSEGGTSVRSCTNQRPLQPWQVTKKHAQLSQSELARLGKEKGREEEEEGSQASSQHSDQKMRRRFGPQPWMKKGLEVNSMEHRFSAQQRMLREQQAALRQQKRVIQDLVYAQQQQQLQQQAQDLQQHQQQLQQLQHHLKQQEGSAQASNVVVSQLTPAGPSGDGRTDPLTLKQVKGGERAGKKNDLHLTLHPQPLCDGGDTQRSEGSSTVSGHTGLSSASAGRPASSAHSNTKYLAVLKNMEDRAAERARLKAEREEKRRLAEEERLEQLKAEEEELKRQAEAEKLAKVMAFREKKRQEKQREEEKKREQELQKELTAKADDHYNKAVMKFRVLLPMKKLVAMAHQSMEEARQHYHRTILRKVVSAWRSDTERVMGQKKELADNLHGYLAVRRCFRNWKNFKYRMVFLERRAERHYREFMLPKLFGAWLRFTESEKQEESERRKQADAFYPRSLQRKVFLAWRRLPTEVKREAEREKARMEMRKKVANILPDFYLSASVTHSTDSV